MLANFKYMPITIYIGKGLYLNMRKEIILVFGIVIGIFLIANVSAGIYFTQLQSVYNLGDMVQMDVVVSPDNSGPMIISLICDGNTTEIYRGAPPEIIQLPLTSLWMQGLTGDCYFIGNYNSETKESTKFKISNKLDIELTNPAIHTKPLESINISGTVKRLNGNNANGEVELSFPTLSNNNQNNNNNIDKTKLYGKVIDGYFNINYIVPGDARANEYRIDFLTYETTGNERTSQGTAIASLKIDQVEKNIDIALDSETTDPGKTIKFNPIVYDQSNNPMSGDVSIVIIDPQGNSIFEKYVNSQEITNLDIQTNASSGQYEIFASSLDINSSKSFFVNEKALIDFSLKNDTIVIRNIGNIPYSNDVQIDLGGKTFIKKIDNLQPGESKEYYLSGTNEEYQVAASDGQTELQPTSTYLTGDAVSVSDNKSPLSGLVDTPIVWILFIIFLGAIILFLFRDILKKKSFAYPKNDKNRFQKAKQDNFVEIKSTKPQEISVPPKVTKIENPNNQQTSNIKIPTIIPVKMSENSKPVERQGFNKVNFEKKADSGSLDRRTEIRHSDSIRHSFANNPYSQNSNRKEGLSNQVVNKVSPSVPASPVVLLNRGIRTNIPNIAEQGLVMDGHKSTAAVVALKLKNDISKFSKENLLKSLEQVYEKKGAIYENGNFIFTIFSPLLTKSFKNEVEATRAAEKISEAIKAHNLKFSDKISYGIGVNSGDIINKIEQGKLKFTSLGTLTIAAKKLADLSNGEVLLTKEAYEKSMTEVNSEKKEIQGIVVYQMKKVADYDKNKKFIKDFLKREKDVRSSMVPRSNISSRPAPFSSTNTIKKPEENVSVLDDSHKNPFQNEKPLN